jgi:sugar lactone lactonase YvrE
MKRSYGGAPSPLSPVALIVVVGWLFAVPSRATSAILYDADWGAGTISTYTTNGTKTVFATGLSAPSGMAFDAQGDLFVACESSGTIDKFSPAGAKTVFATGAGQPFGLAIDKNGNIFVSDVASADGQRIYKYTPGGVRSTFVQGTGQSTLIFPLGLAFDSTGNLYAADFNRVDKFTPAGVESTLAGVSTGAVGIAIAPNGNFYITDDQKEVYQVTPAGVGSLFGSVLSDSSSVAVDPSGNVFVGDRGTAGNIEEFTPTGVRTVFVTGIHDAEGGIAFAVPEPSSLILLAIGVAALAAVMLEQRRCFRRDSGFLISV